MKMRFVFALIFIMGSNYVFAKDNLAILPFTGGQGDEGETIAELFSFDPQLNEVFNPIPRTSITRAINREQNFQMGSGMTDADTIVSIGRQLGAQYVVAGSIASVGNNKLLVISIMDIRNLQQIAGDFQNYRNIEDIRGKLPNMAANIIQTTRNNTAALPKLAIVPVELQGGADQRVADTLAQLLAVHLIRTGVYAVYPRTRSLEQVMNEHNTQLSGVTADASIVGVGYGDNPDMVLSVVARRLGNSNMFNAVIINLQTGTQVMGRSADYRDIDDGMRAMENLAIYLTGSSEQVSQRQQDDRRTQRMQNFGIGLGFRAGYTTPFGLPYPGISLSAIAELKINQFFSLQTEFQFTIAEYLGTFFYIPLLARYSFSPKNFIISPFAGIAFGNGITDSGTLPLSGVIGIETAIIIKESLRAFADLRYSGYFEEGVIGDISISLGIKYFIPFKR